MVLPLRVSLNGLAGETLPAQWAHTIEISHIGCRLGGLHNELSPGQTITLQRGQHKAAFRVIWSKHLATNENQAGIEALDYEKNIWAVELPPSPIVPKAPAFAPLPAQKLTPAAPQPRARQGWGLGLVVVCLVLGLSLSIGIFYESGRLAIQAPEPVPPTAADLARLAPKALPVPSALSKTLDSSVSRLQVAETPTGNVVYPVAPDGGVAGKVQLQIVIAANGLVKQIHAISGKRSLAEAAAQAVRSWHYSPFQGSDRPAERETTVTVNFLGRDAVSLEFPSTTEQVSEARKPE